MIRIGMLIADRYEILEKVGTGGMADVYKAKDHTLNRFVAVKVLKQEFSENENFVAKFRVEAQAAAGLMHPNIVNVYDVGEEKGIYYIVMELVDGITLKVYIQKKGHLSVRETLTVAIQVSMGLEAAHRNHIIHRDIKPQNIIISREGKVKVTDFGIAKAATSDTITSNVMGSVHYTSPEQARGGYSDARSDIYSLGITMFEMLTGELPFTGDTTVAIAIKQIQDPMPSPRKYMPDIPFAVEQIVMKCCEKNPDRRYQNMSELIADLRRAMRDPDGDFVTRYDDDLSKTRAVTQAEREDIKNRTRAKEAEDIAAAADDVDTYASPTKEYRGSGSSKDEDGRSQAGGRRGRRSSDDEEDDEEYTLEQERKNNDRAARILIIVTAVIIALAIVIVAAARIRSANSSASNIAVTGSTSGDSTVTMPKVIGEDVDTAKAALTELGLDSSVKYKETSDYDAGTVIDSSVDEGAEVKVGTTVTLTVAAEETTKVPSVTGKKRSVAEDLIQDAGFEVDFEEEYSDSVEEGYCISQDPEGGTEAQKGSTVTVKVSKGEDNSGRAKVPNLIGMTQSEAQSALEAVGLKLGDVSKVYDNNSGTNGTVIKQGTDSGTYVDEGTSVSVQISATQTYSFSEAIQAPTSSEDPDYKSGTPVTITITDANGTTLLPSTTVTSFPETKTFTGIATATGTLTMTYTDTIETEVSDDAATAGTTGGEGGSGTHTETQEVSKTITRTLTFSAEN